MFKIADDEVERESSSPLRLKKMFVLSALLVEKYHDHVRQQKSRFDDLGVGSRTTGHYGSEQLRTDA